jgi:hypothetical protein
MKANLAQQHSVTQSMKGLTTSGSREASPLSAMVTSQESSPSAFFNHSPSPGTGVEFVNGTMLGQAPAPNPGWATGFEYQNHGLPATQHHGLPIQGIPRMAPQQFPNMPTYKPVLLLHPTPLKSRVETQIPIKMTLFPMPMGITKLHLPTHTISKPKLLAKPTPERSPEMLELYTTLVCTSAMQSPENRRRAFERAAAQDNTEDDGGSDTSDEDDENKPLNGGDVRICVGCITRERKRAARKKIKKVEEEESWHKDEARRVVVFNTHEVKEWQPPTSQPPSEATGDRPEPFIPDGALQVDAPMRIACYCRHQNEKLGFQVIFTIKDHQDRLIAQEMTASIMITDDHKTHNIPGLTAQTSNGSDGQLYSGTSTFPSEGTFDMASGPVGSMAPFRLSHSSSDLQSMQPSSDDHRCLFTFIPDNFCDNDTPKSISSGFSNCALWAAIEEEEGEWLRQRCTQRSRYDKIRDYRYWPSQCTWPFECRHLIRSFAVLTQPPFFPSILRAANISTSSSTATKRSSAIQQWSSNSK